MAALHPSDLQHHGDGREYADIHIEIEPRHNAAVGYALESFDLESYVPIVSDFFDKDLHYDATHYLYEPEDMSELLNAPTAEVKKDVDDPAEAIEALKSIIEKVEESV